MREEILKGLEQEYHYIGDLSNKKVDYIVLELQESVSYCLDVVNSLYAAYTFGDEPIGNTFYSLYRDLKMKLLELENMVEYILHGNKQPEAPAA